MSSKEDMIPTNGEEKEEDMGPYIWYCLMGNRPYIIASYSQGVDLVHHNV